MTDLHASAEDLSPAERERLLAVLRKQATTGHQDHIPRRRSPAPVAASTTQQRLWLMDQIRPGLATYNETAAWRLTGELDVPVLRDTLSEIVRRHESLRTTFAASADGPVQHINDPRPVPLEVTDLTGLPADEQDTKAHALAVEQARQPFDLARGPLLRVSLLRLAPREHVLVLVAHHIVTDGWSTDLFRAELVALYAAFSAGRPSPLGEPVIQYADFAAWQRNRPDAPDLDAQLAYWRRQLAGLPPVLQLPIARPRPEVISHDGAREPFAVPAHLGRGVTEFARHGGATPFMVLLATLQILLHRYTGERDIAIGTALAGREHPDLEQVIGFFANTVVLRGDIGADATFRDVLAQARETSIAAQDNQDVPFESVVDTVRPERSPSFNPLFQTMLVLENAAGNRRHEPGGLKVTPDEIDIGVAKYDLVLQLRAEGDAFTGVWEYSTDLYDTDGIRRLGTHFLTLLEDALAHPDRPIGTLALLPAPELRTVVSDWNATDAPIPTGRRIHELIEEQVERSPEAPAVVDGDRSVTYGELNRGANQLARWLRDSGIEPGAVVGVALRPSADMLTAVLAVLKAGAAYVPMDPAYGPRRLEAMIEDAAPVAVLTHSETASGLPASATRQILLDRIREEYTRRDGRDLELAGSPEDLAYVMFTSGSTGKPHGVQVAHDNLVASTAARGHYYSTPPQRYLLLSSLSFDSSVAGIYWTLTTGGALVLPPTEHAVDIPALCRSMATSRPTHLLCVPSLYDLILDQARPEEVASLECVILAGEPLRQDLVDRHGELLDSVGLFNEYGPTEATVWCTVQRCGPARVPGQVPVGRPIANTRIRLLDRGRQPVPVGVPGELCIGGPGVTRGYVGRPELTAERFIPDPFGPGRLYRSGDLARYLPDGTIQLLGRIDDQVKVRGYRVEPGEIEAALREHPAVEAALVGAPAFDAGHRKIVANVVLRATGTSPADLRQFVRGRVPEFALPSLIEVVDELPRLPNGKVDRAGLVVSATSAAGASTPGAAPAGLTEALHRIWREVLGVDSVGLDDNFFEVGGDSLSIVKVYNEFKPLAGRDITITDMIKYPTISQVISFIGESESTAPVTESERLTEALHRIWREVLGVDSVGLDDNFFEVGGDSLSIVKVYNEFKPLAGRDVTITDMIKYPTIRQVISFLGA
ncbi:amino acid adenylation domain-containing protein [Streptomyces sp. CC224B]|uniref:amino acid adenylation domain-containing protein n=1 Tax=Streptomyces sp. CC224B TaxID=3044571 RepID=UPI0024A808D7|nr:amino acid adenylation domain-containing protein [Streptomyces sp. CC224B]